MSRRLTLIEKTSIAKRAIRESYKTQEREDVEAEITRIATAAYYEVVGDNEEAINDLPIGFMIRDCSIALVREGLPLRLAIEDSKPIPMCMHNPSIDVESLSEHRTLTSWLDKRLELNTEMSDKYAEFYSNIVGPSTTVAGLLKRFPDAYLYFPESLKDEAEELNKARRFLAG